MIHILVILTSLLFSNPITSDIAFKKVFKKLDKTGIPKEYLVEIFSHPKVEKHGKILERFATPYEKKTWEEYRKLFIKDSRILAGVNFYAKNKRLINQVIEHYKIDPFILVSIAGIESNYGKHYKGFTVFSSLYTQIHDMPKRQKWATRELAAYIEYCFKDGVNPHQIEGSYAGAFGFGQFIPTSFNRYSVDFDNDGVRKPHDWPDVLGSISNYLRENGYKPNSLNYKKDGDIWRSIYAYNHSDNYTMAVLELAEKLREKMEE